TANGAMARFTADNGVLTITHGEYCKTHRSSTISLGRGPLGRGPLGRGPLGPGGSDAGDGGVGLASGRMGKGGRLVGEV
ncbi:MAG: hypothetical protein OEZ04_13095, partial [Nitrospinota bacterium]|nr:hypothetical protein [Nitrospinota bacterium]